MARTPESEYGTFTQGSYGIGSSEGIVRQPRPEHVDTKAEFGKNGTMYQTHTYYVPSPIETLKEDIRRIIINGPPTRAINSVPVQGVVDELISRAREKGKKEYGTELETFNGRHALIDAAEEAFDLMQYCVQGHLESLEKDKEIAMLRQLVYDMRAEAVAKEMLRAEGMDETPRQVTQP